MNTIAGNLGPDASEEAEFSALPSIERLRELLDYNPETGLFTRKTTIVSGRYGRKINARPGDIAGRRNSRGYTLISIDGREYMAHRLALYMHCGISRFDWPQKQVDHINRDRSDNRICNLRYVDVTINAQNQSRLPKPNHSTGFVGVRRDKRTSRFIAKIQVNRRLYYLGTYATALEASDAYNAFKKEHHA